MYSSYVYHRQCTANHFNKFSENRVLFLDIKEYNVIKIQKGVVLIHLFVRGFFRGAALLSVFVLFSVWSLFIGPADSVRVFLYCGFIAFFLGFSSMIYHLLHWNFAKRIIIHYMVTLPTVFPILLILNYDAAALTTDITRSFIIFNMIQVLVPSITYSLSEFFKIYGSKYV